MSGTPAAIAKASTAATNPFVADEPPLSPQVIVSATCHACKRTRSLPSLWLGSCKDAATFYWNGPRVVDSGESHQANALSPHPPPPPRPPAPARPRPPVTKRWKATLGRSGRSCSNPRGLDRVVTPWPAASASAATPPAVTGSRGTKKMKRGRRPVRLTKLRRWRRSQTTGSCRTNTHRWGGWEAFGTTAKQTDRRLDAVHSLSSSRMRGRWVGSTAKRCNTPKAKAPARGALLAVDTHPHTRGSNSAAGGAQLQLSLSACLLPASTVRRLCGSVQGGCG